MIRRLCYILVLLVCIMPGAIHAQEADDLSIEVIPSNPGPLAPVQLQAKSFSVDLSQMTITWRYNNKIIDSGVGHTQITTLAPASGAIATISATAGVAGSTASITLRPASIDMLWEAVDSYTPPFYKGKALPAIGAAIRVAAIPSASAPKTISYTWTRNNNILSNMSGYGKNSIVFKNDPLTQTDNISVIARATQFQGTGSTSISTISPLSVGYARNNGFIDYANGGIGILSVKGSGTVLHIEPYFFSVPTTLDNDIRVALTSGSDQVPASVHTNEFALGHPANGTDATFGLAINTVANTLQSLSRQFTVSFY